MSARELPKARQPDRQKEKREAHPNAELESSPPKKLDSKPDEKLDIITNAQNNIGIPTESFEQQSTPPPLRDLATLRREKEALQQEVSVKAHSDLAHI